MSVSQLPAVAGQPLSGKHYFIFHCDAREDFPSRTAHMAPHAEMLFVMKFAPSNPGTTLLFGLLVQALMNIGLKIGATSGYGNTLCASMCSCSMPQHPFFF